MRIKDHDTFEISTFAFSFKPSQRIHSTIHSFAALVEFLLLLLLLLLKKILRNDSHFGCFPIFSSSYSPFIRICFFSRSPDDHATRTTTTTTTKASRRSVDGPEIRFSLSAVLR